jgi:phosphatidylserine synthase 2
MTSPAANAAAAMATPATLEWYEYISAPQGASAKVGVFVWLLLACIVTEILICFKFGRGIFVEPWPEHVLWFWGITGAVFTTFLALWYLRIYSRYYYRQKNKPE